ncbi:hypothetical protein H4R34_000937 [Dimargaris verticillata]|uniref:SCP domain-containing protein n=1 Tax=Dimargaris verticillata TaxID=2761393 RepID=A0A9W8EEX7_9FUNG|nr:hypothetical protein H4R34_000937 [Dimargaris verticillata]
MRWLFAIMVLAALASGLLASPVLRYTKETDAPCTTTVPPKPVPTKSLPQKDDAHIVTITVTITATASDCDCDSTSPPRTTTTEDDTPSATPTTTPHRPLPSKPTTTTPSSSPTTDDDEPQPTGSQKQYQQEILGLVNQHRKSKGAAPLKLDSRLSAVAKKHSDNQMKARKMSHDDPEGSLGKRFKAVGIKIKSAGENVAWNYKSAKAVFNGWKKSPGHNRNMLNPGYKLMGVAESNWYWTQNFAGV